MPVSFSTQMSTARLVYIAHANPRFLQQLLTPNLDTNYILNHDAHKYPPSNLYFYTYYVFLPTPPFTIK